MKDDRRAFIKKGASLAAALSLGAAGTSAAAFQSGDQTKTISQKKVAWPVTEGQDTPKITMFSNPAESVDRMRAIKQFGADHVHMVGPALPWTADSIKAIVDRFKAEGLTVINMMVGFSTDIIHAGPGRDEEIKRVQDAIRAAGAAGVAVMEYNFYAHRAVEGYYDIVGRGGVQYLGYDYNRKGMPDPMDNHWNYKGVRTPEEENMAMSELKPTEKDPAMTKEQLWENITYFLKAIIPVAEQANVRMALHPNDPPPPISRGSEQIMSTFKDWKHLFDVVDSPYNGMTFDCGVSTEIGEDAVEVARYMASRDRIHHVHYRNVIVDTPRIKYTEVFIDNGQVDMLAVMQELVNSKYRFGLWAEHPRENIIDTQFKDGDFVSYLYNMSYARAMLQASLTLQKRGA